jgi:diguanylate cyclase (GGDEF)-like protein
VTDQPFHLESALGDATKLTREGQFGDAISLSKTVFAAARDQGAFSAIAGALSIMAWCLLRTGQSETGHECAALAHRLWFRDGNLGEQARMQGIRALLLLDMGLTDEAFESAETALSEAEAAGDARVIVMAANAKASCLAIARHPELSLPLLERTVALSRELVDDALLGWQLLDLGRCQRRLAENVDASEDVSAPDHWLDLSLESTREAVAVSARCGDTWTLRAALAEAADLHGRLNEMEEAMACIDRWSDVPGEAGIGPTAQYLYTVGDLMTRAGELEAAEGACTEAVSLAEASGQLDHLLNATARLAQLYENKGAFDKALEFHKRYHALYVRQSGSTAQRRARVAEIRFESDMLRVRADRLEEQVLLDPLTGIANRRGLDQILQRLTGQPFAIAILDLDHFKSVNDRFSHAVGDRVLKAVATLLTDQISVHGHPVRMGGEEFAIIFPDAAPATAAVFCEMVRVAIESAEWDEYAPGLTVTVSIGVAAGTGLEQADDIVAAADRRLYSAKAAGRNRVISVDVALVGTRLEA